jgi:small subunit ribosomal protein S2
MSTTPTAPGPEVAAAAPPGAETAAALADSALSVRSLLEAGVHFGHQTRRWNPRMKEFIFGERQGIHIVDLDQTLAHFEDALGFLRDTTAGGGKVLFVGTKRQAAPSIQLEAQRSGQFYVNQRWLGGMLTNYRTVKKSVERFKELKGTLEDEAKANELSKRDRSQIAREVEKLRRSLEGIQEMTRLPDALFVVDVGVEHIAISEARRLGIAIVAVVDTNCNPDGVDFVVPGNDDAIRAIQLYCARVADACLEGARLYQEHLTSEARDAGPGKGEREAAAPTSGRVVVEIKHPPRRGRGGTHSAGGPRQRGTHGGPAPEVTETPAAPEPAGDPGAGA